MGHRKDMQTLMQFGHAKDASRLPQLQRYGSTPGDFLYAQSQQNFMPSRGPLNTRAYDQEMQILAKQNRQYISKQFEIINHPTSSIQLPNSIMKEFNYHKQDRAQKNQSMGSASDLN